MNRATADRGGLRTRSGGKALAVFVWTKRSGERPRFRFYLWPLVLSVVVSILLTIAINS